ATRTFMASRNGSSSATSTATSITTATGHSCRERSTCSPTGPKATCRPRGRPRAGAPCPCSPCFPRSTGPSPGRCGNGGPRLPRTSQPVNTPRAKRWCESATREGALLDGVVGEWLTKVAVVGARPSCAQVSVRRLGARLIGTLPGEVTTTAGRRMREQRLAAARERGLPVSAALIMGLTNGYLEYITTPEEYTAQYYEGGSTLYG